jgi:hypothetical protein
MTEIGFAFESNIAAIVVCRAGKTGRAWFEPPGDQVFVFGLLELLALTIRRWNYS